MNPDTATSGRTRTEAPAADGGWYGRSAQEVATALHVDPGVGLSAARVADLLRTNGPNALPEEKPKPGWRRFVDEYRRTRYGES